MIQRTVADDVVSVILVVAVFSFIMGLAHHQFPLSCGGMIVMMGCVAAATCLHWRDMKENTP